MRTLRQRILWLPLPLLALLPACSDKPKAPPPPAKPAVPPTPKVDPAFVRRALGPGVELVGPALVRDLDPLPGLEAVFTVQNSHGRHEVAVARGDHKVLARVPLGGRLLSGANIVALGQLKPRSLWGERAGGATGFLLPVETTVNRQPVCGLLVLRYRRGALSLVGELASRCWTSLNSKQPGNPFARLKIDTTANPAELRIEGPRGPLTYHWDAAQQAFVDR